MMSDGKVWPELYPAERYMWSKWSFSQENSLSPIHPPNLMARLSGYRDRNAHVPERGTAEEQTSTPASVPRGTAGSTALWKYLRQHK